MYLLFVDGSGTPDLEEFALGGVAVAEERYRELRTRWTGILAASGRAPGSEVKWSRAKGGGATELALADALVACEVTAFVVLVRPIEARAIAPELFATGEDAYQTALMVLAERFQRFLAHPARDERGVIVIDPRDHKQDERLRRFYRRLAEEGTPFTSLDRIVDPILLSPSHETLGIQAADLVVGSILAHNRSDAAGSSSPRAELARRLHERLLPCFAAHPDTGEIVGIKRFPDPTRPLPLKLFELGVIEPAGQHRDPPDRRRSGRARIPSR